MNINEAIETAYKFPAPHQEEQVMFTEHGALDLGFTTLNCMVCFGGEQSSPELCHIVLDLTPEVIEKGVIRKLANMGFKLEEQYHKARLKDGLMLYHFHFKRVKGGLHYAMGSKGIKKSSSG